MELAHKELRSNHWLEIVLTLRKVSLKFLILQDRITKPDGICGLSVGDGIKVPDLCQSMIGLISRGSEIIQMQRLVFRFQDQILKD